MKSKVLVLSAALAIEVLLLRLGFWQLARAQDKQARLQAVAQVLHARHALDLGEAIGADGAYAWVAGEVRLLPEPLLLLDNQRRGAAVGVTAYQLAELGDGRALLVDMGWLPVAGGRVLPRPAMRSGPLALEGLLLPPPSAGFAMGPAYSVQPDGTWLLTRFDRAALQAGLQRPLAARVLRPDPGLNIGFVRDLDVQVNTLPPEKHRAYALQWFGLAAAFAVLCFGFWMRKSDANG